MLFLDTCVWFGVLLVWSSRAGMQQCVVCSQQEGVVHIANVWARLGGEGQQIEARDHCRMFKRHAEA